MIYKHKATGLFVAPVLENNKRFGLSYISSGIPEIKTTSVVLTINKNTRGYIKNQKYWDSLPPSIYIDILDPDNNLMVSCNVSKDLEEYTGDNTLTWDQVSSFHSITPIVSYNTNITREDLESIVREVI